MSAHHTPGQRCDFEMSEAQLAALLDMMKPQPYLISAGGIGPRSQQENANDAWARLGEELGFEHMTVKPNGRGDRFFSAIAKATSQEGGAA